MFRIIAVIITVAIMAYIAVQELQGTKSSVNTNNGTSQSGGSGSIIEGAQNSVHKDTQRVIQQEQQYNQYGQ